MDCGALLLGERVEEQTKMERIAMDVFVSIEGKRSAIARNGKAKRAHLVCGTSEQHEEIVSPDHARPTQP